MVEKLPSLKEGGAFWFTDLTAPDALYIFPAITALSLMIRLEVRTALGRVLLHVVVLCYRLICLCFWIFSQLILFRLSTEPLLKPCGNHIVQSSCPCFHLSEAHFQLIIVLSSTLKSEYANSTVILCVAFLSPH